MSLDREYISVAECALRLGKGHRRVYEMVSQGLLEEVGFTVYRTEKRRIWVGFPNAAFSSLCCLEEPKGGP